MKSYRIKIDSKALSDIREITEWYEMQQNGLGNRFKSTVIHHIDHLKESPQSFAIRYHQIRCMIIKKFPYMIHFYINEQTETVIILAVISTDRNPMIWKEKTKRP